MGLDELCCWFPTMNAAKSVPGVFSDTEAMKVSHRRQLQAVRGVSARRRIGVVVDLSAMLYLWRTASPNSSSRALFLSGLSTRVGGVELARVREAQALSLL